MNFQLSNNHEIPTESFKENGFIHLKKFIKFNDIDLNNHVLDCFNLIDDFSIDTNKEISSFLSELFIQIQNKDKGKLQEFKDIYLGIFQRNMAIYELASNPAIKTLLNKFGIKKPYLCSDPLLMINEGSDHAILGSLTNSPLHQDWASMQSSQNSVILWIPLVDMCPESSSSIRVWPKSHLHGLITPKDNKWFSEITDDNFLGQEHNPIDIEYDKGDCILFSSLLVHKTIFSKRNYLPRLTIQLRYGDLSCGLLKRNKGVFNYMHCFPNKRISERPNLEIPRKT